MSETITKSEKFNLEQNVNYSAASVVSKTLLKGESGNLTLFSFDKGQGLSEHSAPFDASVMILDGAVEITIGGKINLLEKGDFIIMPANIPHALKAINQFKMLLIMIKNKPEQG